MEAVLARTWQFTPNLYSTRTGASFAFEAMPLVRGHQDLLASRPGFVPRARVFRR